MIVCTVVSLEGFVCLLVLSRILIQAVCTILAEVQQPFGSDTWSIVYISGGWVEGSFARCAVCYGFLPDSMRARQMQRRCILTGQSLCSLRALVYCSDLGTLSLLVHFC